MAKRTEFRGSFQAVSATGTRYKLILYVDVIGGARFGDRRDEVDGHQSIRTSQGLPVARLDKGRYKIVATGEIVTSDDPEAA